MILRSGWSSMIDDTILHEEELPNATLIVLLMA